MEKLELCEHVLKLTEDIVHPDAYKLRDLINFEIRTEAPRTLEREIQDCNACGLREGCKTHVPGEGPMPAELMFVGEGPGQVEDNTGRPFVGPAGQLLDKIITAAGWHRENVFITNIVKCRPPSNRTPHIGEVAKCKHFLDKQIELVKPKVVVCWGGPAASTLIHPNFAITKEHGVWFGPNKDGSKPRLIAIYHPAYILRIGDAEKQRAIKREVWADIQKVIEYLK